MYTFVTIYPYRCVVPAIAMVTPIIDYKRCFLNHPYELNAKLYNDSDLPAKYDLVPQVSQQCIRQYVHL